MSTLRPCLGIVAKSLWAGYVTPRAAVRMAAYAVLAKLASDEVTGHAMTYKMHIGAMRGTFRREVVKYRLENAIAQALGV